MQHPSFEPSPENPYSELDNLFAAMYWEAQKVKDNEHDTTNAQQPLCERPSGKDIPEI